MKAKQRNMVYEASFDGDILRYKSRQPVSIILKLFGLNDKLEIPINIVLRYKIRQRFFVFTILKLTIDRYKFGQTRPNPTRLSPILFIRGRKKVIEQVVDRVNQNIQQASEGRSVGFFHIKGDELKLFYASRNIDDSIHVYSQNEDDAFDQTSLLDEKIGSINGRFKVAELLKLPNGVSP